MVHRLRESGCSSRIVFLTVHTDPDVIRAALETGALGYVVKTSLTTELLLAIHEVFQGRTFVSLETSAARSDQEYNHPHEFSISLQLQ